MYTRGKVTSAKNLINFLDVRKLIAYSFIERYYQKRSDKRDRKYCKIEVCQKSRLRANISVDLELFFLSEID